MESFNQLAKDQSKAGRQDAAAHRLLSDNFSVQLICIELCVFQKIICLREGRPSLSLHLAAFSQVVLYVQFLQGITRGTLSLRLP